MGALRTVSTSTPDTNLNARDHRSHPRSSIRCTANRIARKPISFSLARSFNGRRGETREGCKASGMHSFYMLGPDNVCRLMREIDGATWGILLTDHEKLTRERKGTV